jgi:hypothetical protein
MAAEYGHLEVLKYAHANGCPWDYETCAQAEKNEHTDVLEWARLHGCSDDEFWAHIDDEENEN